MLGCAMVGQAIYYHTSYAIEAQLRKQFAFDYGSPLKRRIL